MQRWLPPSTRAAAWSEYLRPNVLDVAPASASTAFTASRPSSSATMFVASFDDTTIIRSTTSASGIGVPAGGMPSSMSSGSIRKSGAPGASDANVSALATSSRASRCRPRAPGRRRRARRASPSTRRRTIVGRPLGEHRAAGAAHAVGDDGHPVAVRAGDPHQCPLSRTTSANSAGERARLVGVDGRVGHRLGDQLGAVDPDGCEPRLVPGRSTARPSASGWNCTPHAAAPTRKACTRHASRRRQEHGAGRQRRDRVLVVLDHAQLLVAGQAGEQRVVGGGGRAGRPGTIRARSRPTRRSPCRRRRGRAPARRGRCRARGTPLAIASPTSARSRGRNGKCSSSSGMKPPPSSTRPSTRRAAPRGSAPGASARGALGTRGDPAGRRPATTTVSMPSSASQRGQAARAAALGVLHDAAPAAVSVTRVPSRAVSAVRSA